ncbi:putative F-box protein PP2-B12 [Carex littledalei]|uniref:Putative F-box protein PP2-B12 n=1 Tax=Carex littledalei TaxID=544730 RepID=A0A833RZQ9_9POAL|nr:putative F-box protein PP2-B12 [Carex littledalei]
MDSPIYSLPDDCLCHVISLTSPRDVYNFSLASICFRSVVDVDAIWQAFLPSDYAVILSRAVNPVMFTSLKDLFFKLSESYVLIDGGTTSFGLERSSAAKCYMISTSLLKIDLADVPPFCWRRISPPDSRVIRIVPSRLHIVGKINSKSLSSKTRYGAYLVNKLIDTDSDIFFPIGRIRQQTSVTVGRHISKNIVYLEPFYTKYMPAKDRFALTSYTLKVIDERPEFDDNNEIIANKRDDGWIEVELGAFNIDKDEDREMEIKLLSVEGSSLENQIILQGIEIRPKH